MINVTQNPGGLITYFKVKKITAGVLSLHVDLNNTEFDFYREFEARKVTCVFGEARLEVTFPEMVDAEQYVSRNKDVVNILFIENKLIDKSQLLIEHFLL